MPWSGGVSVTVPCRTNYLGQPSKPPENKWKPLVDWIWPAGSQEGFWALTNASLRKENRLFPSAVSVPAVTGFSPVAGRLCRCTSFELGLSEAMWWERPWRAGLSQGWLPTRQLAGWKECTCAMNIFSATVSAQPSPSVSTVGCLTSAERLMCTVGYLQKTKQLKLLIGKRLCCRSGNGKGVGNRTKQIGEDCTAAKLISKYQPPKKYYRRG